MLRTQGHLRLTILAVALVVCAACGDAPTPPPEDDTAIPVTVDLLAEGRLAYRKYCVQCHGYGGRGDGSSAAHLEPAPRDHTDAVVMDAIADGVIAATVRYGGNDRGFPNMPAFPQVSDDELTALVAYVRSLSRPGVESIDLGGTD